MTRTIIQAVITLTVLSLLLFVLWPKPEPLYPTAGSTVVVFGDSLAAGVGSSRGNDITTLLAASLDYPIINRGVSGDTTADGLARIESTAQADPRVVVVLLGGNDAIQKKPIEETFKNLAEIIRIIQSTGAAVVLVGEPGGLYGKEYEKEYRRLAEEYRTFYVSNILSGLIGRPEYMSDYIHPNDKGYAVATARILPEVQRALAGSN